MRHVWLDAKPIIDVVEARGGLGTVLRYEPQGGAMGWLDNTLPSRSDDPECQRWEAAFRRMKRSGRVTMPMADRFCLEVLDIQAELIFGWAFFEDEVAV